MVRKIGKQITVNWVNESISEHAISILDNIDINFEEFITEFKTIIGRYRFYKEFNDTAPMPKETIEHLNKILRQIKALTENIRLIPSNAHAWNTEVIVKEMLDYQHYQCLMDREMIKHLNKYSLVLDYTIDKIKTTSNQKGRNNNWQENKLVFETYLLFKKHYKTMYKAQDTYHFISIFLIANGIHVPFEAENIRKIINKIKRLKNTTSEVPN